MIEFFIGMHDGEKLKFEFDGTNLTVPTENIDANLVIALEGSFQSIINIMKMHMGWKLAVLKKKEEEKKEEPSEIEEDLIKNDD